MWSFLLGNMILPAGTSPQNTLPNPNARGTILNASDLILNGWDKRERKEPKEREKQERDNIYYIMYIIFIVIFYKKRWKQKKASERSDE